MSRLEEKLIELGYELTIVEYMNNKQLCKTYEKPFKHCYIVVWAYTQYEYLRKPYHLFIKYNHDTFARQEVIDNLQQAFNTMQKDLEELKKYEDKNI